MPFPCHVSDGGLGHFPFSIDGPSAIVAFSTASPALQERVRWFRPMPEFERRNFIGYGKHQNPSSTNFYLVCICISKLYLPSCWAMTAAPESWAAYCSYQYPRKGFWINQWRNDAACWHPWGYSWVSFPERNTHAVAAAATCFWRPTSHVVDLLCYGMITSCRSLSELYKFLSICLYIVFLN